MAFTPIILIHVLAASGALLIGGITLLLEKGTLLHRLFGRTWIALMLITAVESFGIRSTGHFSWIHLLSVGTLLAMGGSIYAIMHGQIKAHRQGMILTYVGLAIAGAFTLLPGRRLGYLVWHAVGLV